MNVNRRLTFQDFQEVMSEAVSVPANILDPNASIMGDLSLDSLKMVELVLRLEKEFDITIPVEDAWDIRTVNDIYEVCARQLGVTV